jgi:hypothetical protein
MEDAEGLSFHQILPQLYLGVSPKVAAVLRKLTCAFTLGQMSGGSFF